MTVTTAALNHPLLPEFIQVQLISTLFIIIQNHHHLQFTHPPVAIKLLLCQIADHEAPILDLSPCLLVRLDCNCCRSSEGCHRDVS